MKFERSLRDLSLRAIAFLVILIALWALVLLAGVAMNWSFLTSKIQEAFYLGGFLVALLIFALAVVNVAACLSMIAKAQTKEPGHGGNVVRQFFTMLAAAAAIALLVIGGLWYAEWKVYRSVTDEVRETARALTQSTQFKDFAQAIREDAPAENVFKIRDALNTEIGGANSVAYLIPVERSGVTVYYELNHWHGRKSGDQPFSNQELSRFIPKKREREDFGKLTRGEIDSFVAPAGNSHLRYFSSQVVDGQQIILLLDTSRQLDNYRSSFK